MAKPKKRRDALAPALRGLVKGVEAALGRVVAQVEGRRLYEVVEAVRLDMVAVREGNPLALGRARRRLRRLSVRQRTALARAYTIYLELVNVCENAYRTHRLRARARDTHSAGEATARANVIFVLTAHPTESRSPANIRLMRRIQTLLIEGLERRDPPDRERLTHLLHLVWRAGTHPARKPTVEDEALHLFSLLDTPILEELLRLRREGHLVRLRTWVGGDKDGHSGVAGQPAVTGRRVAGRPAMAAREHPLPHADDSPAQPDPDRGPDPSPARHRAGAAVPGNGHRHRRGDADHRVTHVFA